jgi:L-ascorbate metabolism protein UlaG (beta-lactamase superfamily)
VEDDDAHQPGRPAIEVTATPARHGPPMSRPITGDVVGFALRWDGQDAGVLWLSGDTVLIDVDTALLHLGGVRFPVTGLRYSMTAREAVEPCRLARPRTAIPVHYEGWTRFRPGRDAIEEEFARAPAEVRERLRRPPLGDRVDLAA